MALRAAVIFWGWLAECSLDFRKYKQGWAWIVARKRYYHDSKGRLKGYSSDRLSPRESMKALAIGLALLLLFTFIMDNGDGRSDEAELVTGPEKKGAVEIGREEIQTSIGSDPLVSANLSSEWSSVESAEIAAGVDVPLRESGSPMSTQDYVEQTYVDGDLSCPRDIIDVYRGLCAEGDQSACIQVSNCEP